jgi:ABC-type Fe3+ transport system substrate-binding protein
MEAAHPEGAEAFIDVVSTPEGQAVLGPFGVVVP